MNRSSGSLVSLLLAAIVFGALPANSESASESLQTANPSNGPTAIFQNVVKTLSRQSGFEGIRVGFWLEPVASPGVPLVTNQAKETYVPASVMKCLTAIRYLEDPPAPYFSTTVFRKGNDLVLVGGWDPDLSPAQLEQLAQRLAGSLPKQIGTVWVDSKTGFSDVPNSDPNKFWLFTLPYPPGWSWDDLSENYAPEIRSLTVSHGVRQGQPIRDCDLEAAGIFVKTLQKAGVAVNRGPLRLEAPRAANQGWQQVANINSRPCGEILKQGMAASDNLVLECFYQLCDRTRPKAVLPTINSQRLVDGSGLSRYNLLSVETLASSLRSNPKIYDFLPVAGGEGTLQKRFNYSPLQGHLWAKTGTMSGVSSLAGSFEGGRTGTRYMFVWMANGFSGSAKTVKQAEEQVLSDLYRDL